MQKLNNKIGINIYTTFFLIILLFLSVVQPFKPIDDPDMFWHIETGNYILENFSIPHNDVFSYFGIENNLPWIAHEWLSDVIFALIYNLGGYTALQFFPTIMLFFIFLLIHKKTKTEDTLEKYIWYFLSFLMIGFLSEIRAHMFSWLFCSITIFVLFDFYNNKKNNLFLLPIISCLWVNMHGGSSSLIFLLIGAFLFVSLFNLKIGKITNIKQENKKTNKLFLILIISILTALINPNGYKILLYPFENMQDTLMLSVITEWHSPDFHTAEGLIIFIFLSVIVTALVTTKKEIKLIDFLLIGAFTYLSLKSIRQVVYLSIIAIPIIINYLPQLFKVKSDKTIGNTIIASFVILFSIFFVFTGIFGPKIEPNLFPSEQAMKKIEEISPKRMLNNYDWGGYFIKNLNQKEILPFIDGRADVYSKYTLQDYTNLMYLENGWEQILDKYNFDCIVMTTNNLFTREVSKLSEWEINYSDELTTILIRKK